MNGVTKLRLYLDPISNNSNQSMQLWENIANVIQISIALMKQNRSKNVVKSYESTGFGLNISILTTKWLVVSLSLSLSLSSLSLSLSLSLSPLSRSLSLPSLSPSPSLPFSLLILLCIQWSTFWSIKFRVRNTARRTLSLDLDLKNNELYGRHRQHRVLVHSSSDSAIG